MIKICPVCNKEFIRRYGIKYCSLICSEIGRKELAKIQNKRYMQEHKKERNEYMKQYRIEHKEEIAIKSKQWQKAHLSDRRKQSKRRLKTDICFKMSVYLNHRMYMALKGLWKSAHTEELLGCSVEFLKLWLETQFQEGMTWRNWGRNNNCWQIDHIIPCASFDLRDPEQQKTCFNYTNLRPLWAVENRIKHDKILRERRD